MLKYIYLLIILTCSCGTSNYENYNEYYNIWNDYNAYYEENYYEEYLYELTEYFYNVNIENDIYLLDNVSS